MSGGRELVVDRDPYTIPSQGAKSIPRMQAIADCGDVDALWTDEQFLLLARSLAILNHDLRRRGVSKRPFRVPPSATRKAVTL